MAKTERTKFHINDIHNYLRNLFKDDMHDKRIYSLANATLGIMVGASLAIQSIGAALAQARSLLTKHAVKQVDRLLSNPGIDVWSSFSQWVPHVIGARKSIVVAMDWTEFDSDNHSTIMLSLVTRHGRSTPLIWLTVIKDKLKGQRNDHEDAVLGCLAQVIPEGTHVTILADRGFGDQKLFDFLKNQLSFDYVIRFRGNTYVANEASEQRQASEWVGKGGRARTLRNATITDDHYPVDTIVCVHAKGMKEAWCLATSLETASARTLINYYAKRWTIEPSFRDSKDPHFGMGMSQIRINATERRDRLFLLNAFAIFLLTLLGAACESVGYDRYLRANTVKRRTHSLFRQGCMIYELLPTMPDKWFKPIIQKFGELLRTQKTISEVYGIV